MSIPHQTTGQRIPDQAAGPCHQDDLTRRADVALKRALFSGSCASVVSTLCVSWFSRLRNRAAPAGTNATSQWVWGRKAHRRDDWSVRHTALGYGIHHVCSIFWATGYEFVRRGRSQPAAVVPLAAATTVLAYVVDYKVVHPRLSPGFDQRIKGRDMVLVYAAFGLGLALPWLIGRRARRSGPRKAPGASAIQHSPE